MDQPTLFADYGPVEHAAITVHHRHDGWVLTIAVRRERMARFDEPQLYTGLCSEELADVVAAVLRS